MVKSIRDDRMINDNYYVYKKRVLVGVASGREYSRNYANIFQNTIKKFLPRGQFTDIYLVDMWRKY